MSICMKVSASNAVAHGPSINLVIIGPPYITAQLTNNRRVLTRVHS
jgi:hypothetical protein